MKNDDELLDSIMNQTAAGASLEDDWGAALSEQATVAPAPPVKPLNQQTHSHKAPPVEPPKPASFTALRQESSTPVGNIDMILDIPLTISVELGRTKMIVNDLLKLSQGSVVELEKLAGEPMEILVNGRLIARGEAVVINEKFAVKITDIVSQMERINNLK